MTNSEKRTCVLLSREDSFESLANALETAHPGTYERLQTPAGTRLLKSGSTGPHVALLRNDPDSLKKDLAWLESQWHPSRYVSTGTNELPGGLGDGAPILIPSRCLRSVSRPEAELEYVLYDEFDFDASTREHLLSAAPEFKVRDALLFSGPKKEIGADEMLWIHRKLGCSVFDDLTGELLNVARRFSSKVGCVRFLEGQAALEAYWTAYSDAPA